MLGMCVQHSRPCGHLKHAVTRTFCLQCIPEGRETCKAGFAKNSGARMFLTFKASGAWTSTSNSMSRSFMCVVVQALSSKADGSQHIVASIMEPKTRMFPHEGRCRLSMRGLKNQALQWERSSTGICEMHDTTKRGGARLSRCKTDSYQLFVSVLLGATRLT